MSKKVDLTLVMQSLLAKFDICLDDLVDFVRMKTDEKTQLFTLQEGLKKYDELRKLVLTQFDEALPFFKKAEMLNPNDRNTLIALKEIFARKDDLPTSTEFKNRLEKVEAGGSNESSYFNK